MTEGGFFDRKSASPFSLAIVLAMHAAALGGLALIKGPEMARTFFPRLEASFVPIPPDPPENPPPPRADRATPLPPVIDRVEPRVATPIERPQLQPLPSAPPVLIDPRPPAIPQTRPPTPPPAPVRTAAQVDPRFAGDLQPPYPTSELRAEREGSVRVRVTIAADGRVKAIERLSSTSDAFWQATERHALARWRFRPATVDGRPVESSKVMTVQFQLRA